MSISSEAVKKTAKAALGSKRLSSFVCCVIAVCTFFLIQYLSALFEMVMGAVGYTVFIILSVFFIFMPLCLGMLRFFWRILFGVEDKIISLFYYFSSKKLYFKAMKFLFNISLRFFFCGLVFCIPMWIADFFSGEAFYNMLGVSMPMWVSNLWLISALFEFAAVVAIIVLGLKYYIAPVLFIADSGMDEFEAIHMSGIVAKGSSSDFVYLVFSLIGWIILCVFAIPTPFILPYLICCYLVHCRFSIAKYNKYISDCNSGKYFSAGAI